MAERMSNVISCWKAWADVNTRTKGLSLARKLASAMGTEHFGLRAEKYHKGGYVTFFNIEHPQDAWNDFVVDVIGLGQKVASDWILTGNVQADPSGWSTRCRISGITAVSWDTHVDWTARGTESKGGDQRQNRVGV